MARKFDAGTGPTVGSFIGRHYKWLFRSHIFTPIWGMRRQKLFKLLLFSRKPSLVAEIEIN